MRLLTLCLILCILPLGCSHTNTPNKENHAVEDRGVTVVLPFVDMAKIFGSNTSVRNPITSKVSVTGNIEEKAALDLTNKLYRLIGPETGLKWGALKEPPVSGGADGVGLFGAQADHRKKLQALGRREGADTIMVGFLYAFENRTGGDYGVKKPSHVAFELILMKSESGRIVWQRSFTETQKSLSEDLMQIKKFFKRKGRWVSAQEMAEGALKEMLKTIPQHDAP